MSDRLEKLQRMLERTPEDPFLIYGVAMEYRKAGRHGEAVVWFDKTLAVDAQYCYAYFQKGQAFEELGEIEQARQAYRAGIEAARRKQDTHAEAELTGALDMLAASDA